MKRLRNRKIYYFIGISKIYISQRLFIDNLIIEVSLVSLNFILNHGYMENFF